MPIRATPSPSAQNGLARTVFCGCSPRGKTALVRIREVKQKTGGFSQPKQPHQTHSRHPERFWVVGGRGKGKKVERVRVMIQTRRRPKPALGREREVQIRNGPIPMLVFSYHLDRRKKPWQFFRPPGHGFCASRSLARTPFPCSLVMRLRIGEQWNALAPAIYARIA